jgi:hypothetical protein
MEKYQINDRVANVRFSAGTDRVVETLKVGTITSKPFKVEGIDHYKVKWDDLNPHIMEPFVVDARSKKYGFVKI